MSKIFISYRRDDSEATAQTIYSTLAARFGRDRVFFDKRSIPLGVNYATYIDQELSQASFQVVIIGPKWLGQTDGHRRIDDASDPVRVEVEAASRRSIPQFPIILSSATMPPAESLPSTLASIHFANGVSLKQADPRSDADFAQLVARLAKDVAVNDQAPGWNKAMTSKMDECGFVYTVRDAIEYIVPPVRQIAAGRFTMGGNAASDESSPHQVTLPTYWIGAYPVTVVRV